MSFNKNSNPKKYISNNEMAKNMKKKAHFFLIVSLLADVFVCIYPTISRSITSFVFVAILFPPLIILPLMVKLSAILLGHFRHNDWQCNNKKLIYRMETILLIIIVDIASIIVLGVIIYIFNIRYYHGGGYSAGGYMSRDPMEAMLEELKSLAVLSGPAIILGTIISLADTVKIKKFISKKIIPIKFIPARTIIILFSLAIAILLSILVISAVIG